MVELIAPRTIALGRPFSFTFRSDERIAGRLRLTAGTEAVPFVLERPGREAVRSDGHRIRGKEGSYRILDWGEHPVGSELVLRFEGRKLWLEVVASVDDAS